MAHNITTRDGMFTVRQAAWHGLGTVLPDYPTRAEAQALAHPWEPQSEPVYRKRVRLDENGVTESFEVIEDAVLNTRSDDHSALGVVSGTFTVVSNGEMYDIAEVIEGVDKGSVRYETGGSLKGGRKVWLLLRLAEPIKVLGDPNGDVIPYYALQNAHDGSGAFRGQATMTRIVCHEVGTPMLHKGEWLPVEQHPTFRGTKREDGLKVFIAGLPFPEVVTLDHKYQTSLSQNREDWRQAQHLIKGESEIIYPIDMTEIEDTETYEYWWAVGRWWADGHLTDSGVGWSISDSESETRLLKFLHDRGFTGQGSKRPGCTQIVAGRMPEMHAMLGTWYSKRADGDRGKGSREKVPPAWVEKLPIEAQRALVEGYFSGDGYTQKDREARIFLSSSLNGLLSLRRILMRLGQPCAIRKGRKAALASVIQGRQVDAKDQWSLRVAARPQGVRIEDGVLYSRVKSLEWAGEREFVPVTTEDHTYLSAFGRSSNCDNTAQMADMDAQVRGTEFVFSHTKNVKDRIEEAKKALAGWRLSVARFQDQSAYLLTLGIDVNQRELFLEQFIPAPIGKAVSDRVMGNIEGAREMVREILRSKTCEGISGTAYGLVQASVEFLQHERKAHSQESRFQRAYLDRNKVTAHAVTLAEKVAINA